MKTVVVCETVNVFSSVVVCPGGSEMLVFPQFSVRATFCTWVAGIVYRFA